MQYIFHTLMAQYSLIVLKVQPTNQPLCEIMFSEIYSSREDCWLVSHWAKVEAK